jgi:hypothetical protein
LLVGFFFSALPTAALAQRKICEFLSRASHGLFAVDCQ